MISRPQTNKQINRCQLLIDPLGPLTSYALSAPSLSLSGAPVSVDVTAAHMLHAISNNNSNNSNSDSGVLMYSRV